MTDTLDDWGGDLGTLLHTSRWGFSVDAIAYRLQSDPQFALEMRLCREWQIPHSQFLSWEPEDQAKALGYFYYENRRCRSCGIHPDDWPDPNEPVFEAVSDVCPGCAEIDRYERYIKDRAEQMPKSAMDGHKVHLRRVGDDG